MNYIETTICAGAAQPFRFLHISDQHLALADDRDDPRKRELAARRVKGFPHAASDLAEAARVARENGGMICHTGDLIDFVSAANLDVARKFMAENDVFFTVGNHEFSQYVGEAFEDAPYRAQSLERVQAAFPADIRFCARVINGVKLIGIDDGYYLFDRPQLDALRREAADGLPIVLFLHNPLYTPALYRAAMAQEACAYLVAVPEPLMQGYDDYRYRQQLADDVTRETVEFIEHCPQIRAIFTGHLHCDFESVVADRLPQFTTGVRSMRMVTVT